MSDSNPNNNSYWTGRKATKAVCGKKLLCLLRVIKVLLPSLLVVCVAACDEGNDGWSWDIKAPTVSSVSPANGALNVTFSTSISATLSEAMDESTINTSTFILMGTGGGVTGAVSYDSNTNTAFFAPSGDLAYDKLYTTTITTGMRDAAGNNLASDYHWSFTTIGKVTVTWDANRESAVNSTGGGYRVYYSTSFGFNPGDAGVTEINVPYVSGNAAPTSTDISLPPGTYCFKVAAYSALTPPGGVGGSVSEPSAEVSVRVP